MADAAPQVGVRPIQLAQAVREGKVATVRGRGSEMLIAPDELEGRAKARGFFRWVDAAKRRPDERMACIAEMVELLAVGHDQRLA